jgi:hypothetical protein
LEVSAGDADLKLENVKYPIKNKETESLFLTF